MMSVSLLRNFFLWCGILNYGILITWMLLMVFANGWLYRLTQRFFRLPVEQFNQWNYGAIVLYKCGAIMFNFIPCLALYIVG